MKKLSILVIITVLVTYMFSFTCSAESLENTVVVSLMLPYHQGDFGSARIITNGSEGTNHPFVMKDGKIYLNLETMISIIGFFEKTEGQKISESIEDEISYQSDIHSELAKYEKTKEAYNDKRYGYYYPLRKALEDRGYSIEYAESQVTIRNK